MIVVFVVAVLAVVVGICLAGSTHDAGRLAPGGGAAGWGVLQAAGLLFFAFAGYARISTLGEEVRDPARNIPRAIPLALGGTLVIYALVAAAVLMALGPGHLAAATAPLAEAVRAAGAPSLVPLVRVAAATASLGALLALLLGVSRTTLAMARDRHLPHVLARVHPRRGVPYPAELAVGGIVIALTVGTDLRGAIGFSSFAVLLYYAIANASAWTLTAGENPPPRLVPALGLGGCVLLAGTLPAASVIAGAAVLAVGAAIYAARRIA